MGKNSSKLAMMAQVAISHGDAINSYRLLNEDLSVPEAIEVLAQSFKYKEVLPNALSVYTRNGARIGNVIASFPEFDHRRTVARELSDLLETSGFDVLAATTNLENIHVQEQLYAVEKTFFKRTTGDSINPVVKLAVKNALYGQHQITDRLLREAPGSSEMIPALQLAIERFKPASYNLLVNEIFGLYSELNKKDDVQILHPGIALGDVGLTKALGLFARKYQEFKKEDSWSFFMPGFNQPPERYSWGKNTFEDTVRRLTSLFENGSVAFVDQILGKINGTRRPRFGSDPICENPAEILEYAEKIKAANLPIEIYRSFATEFDSLSVVNFARGLLQETVLAKIKGLDKMRNTFAKAAIGYTACHEDPESVQYVAEHILDVTPLGNAKSAYKAIMAAGREGKGAERLKAFLPEGIDFKKLSGAVREIIRKTGVSGELEHMALFHEILRENQDRLAGTNNFTQGSFPFTYKSMNPIEVRKRYEEYLGVRKTDSN